MACIGDVDGAAETAELVRKSSRRAEVWHVDLADREAVEAAVNEVVDKLGRIDICVSNGAGG